MPIRHIESAVAIESHHAVEARAIKEEKVERSRLGIEAVANSIVVGLATIAQFFSFSRKKAFGKSRCQAPDRPEGDCFTGYGAARLPVELFPKRKTKFL